MNYGNKFLQGLDDLLESILERDAHQKSAENLQMAVASPWPYLKALSHASAHPHQEEKDTIKPELIDILAVPTHGHRHVHAFPVQAASN